MKKAIIIALFAIITVSAQAQTAPQPAKEQPVSIKLLPSELSALQQVLGFSYQWLPKSDAPAKEVGQVVGVIQALFPKLVADTAKVVKPVLKGGKQ